MERCSTQIIPVEHLKAVAAINEGGVAKVRQQWNGDDIFSGFLTCADPRCKRAVVYEPHTKTLKSTGKETVYHYYRCSNSRKIHPKKEHVTEDKIWQQFEPAIDDLTISEEFAKLIADALNETQEKQRAAIKKQMEGFKMELKTLDAREDSAYLDYSKGVLDEAGYRRQVKRMRAERDDYTEQLERLNLAISDAGMSSVKEVIELAINARSLWKGMNREERLEYLKRVCSNQTLDGLTVRYQLEKPFARLASWKQNEGWRREWDSLAPHASDREK